MTVLHMWKYAKTSSTSCKKTAQNNPHVSHTGTEYDWWSLDTFETRQIIGQGNATEHLKFKVNLNFTDAYVCTKREVDITMQLKCGMKEVKMKSV